jgi:DNA-binding CsgD family transcriptional regulator
VLGLRAAGYSRDEIAELTGESHRTIDRHLGRARRKLRDALWAGPALG